MSHRKSKKSDEHNEVKEHSFMEGLIWNATGYTIARLQIGRDLIMRPHLPFQEFFSALKDMDETGSIIGKLDRNSLEKLAPEDRIPFLDFYTTTCITGLARKSGILDSLVRAGIITFQNPEKPGGPPGMADHPSLASILTPIKHEYPYFCNQFLGILQSRLETTLKKERLLDPKWFRSMSPGDDSMPVRPPGDKAAFERHIEKTRNFLTPRRIMSETRMAIIMYFDHEIKLENRILTRSFSNICLSHVFLWLLYLDLLEEITDDLLIGRPMLRRMMVDGLEEYVLTEEGRDALISTLTGEDK